MDQGLAEKIRTISQIYFDMLYITYSYHLCLYRVLYTNHNKYLERNCM